MLTGHELIWPWVTSQPPLLPLWHHGLRGGVWVKVKCAGTAGCRPNHEWTEAGNGRVRQRKSVEAEREGFLIRFLGRMTKLCGMQWRGEREVIKSSRTKRGRKIVYRRRERGLLNKPGWQGHPLIHFPFPIPLPFCVFLSHFCHHTTMSYVPTVTFCIEERDLWYILAQKCIGMIMGHL